MSFTDPQAQPAPGQDPQTTPDPTIAAPSVPSPIPAAPPASQAAPAPWTSDLNAIFADEATRGQVDQYLRTKVQPYTTQLEQKAAVSEQANRLWQGFETDPIDTYVAVTTELFGEQAGVQMLEQLQQQQAAQQQPGQQAQPAAQIDPRLQSVIDYVENQQTNQQYEQNMTSITAQHPDVDPDLFHPFVAAAGGDFNEAYNLYTAYQAQFQTKFGVQLPAEPAPVAPAVMGSDTAAAQSSATPTAPRKQTLDEAINDFMSEQRTNREAPPVV
jgi:hypothetical protein